MNYGQFCPIAKAAEVLGDKWTLLIVRELLMGATRYSELERGLNAISPTMLSKRLNEMVTTGIAVKKRIPGQRGFEYFLTDCGRELFPIVEQLGIWGMRWARQGMPVEDLDLELLMLYLERSVDPDKLIGRETVIRFQFTDLTQFSHWWLVVQGDAVDTCIQDPGKEVDIYFTTDLRTMIAAWMGDCSYRDAIAHKRLVVVGPADLTRNISNWLKPGLFAGVPPATAIQPPVYQI